MLQAAWASPVMPELVASLPIAGVDGTLRRSQSRSALPTSKPAACAT
jgi:D-alanyl-D-alanine carboxypeptidase/D-alanyl-D-alanine-endopeptidase (penicillin-binding protein 4)